jgi:hypothetical protein
LPIKILRQLHAQVNIRRNHVKRLLRSVDVGAWREFSQIDEQDFSGSVKRAAQALRSLWKLPCKRRSKNRPRHAVRAGDAAG